MQIVEMLIPASNKNTRPGIVMFPKFITIHETGNTEHGADALSHAQLQQKGNSRQASWHYSVDCADKVYQSIPDKEVSWACGDGQGKGNMSSISIEICVNPDGDFEKAKANAIQLTKVLMAKHSIPVGNVVPHHRWSGKDCPHNILASGWNKFIEQLTRKTVIVTLNPYDYPQHLLKVGSKGEAVKLVQKELGVLVDGIFGKHTEAAVKSFQKAHRLVIDGIIGAASWKTLFG